MAQLASRTVPAPTSRVLRRQRSPGEFSLPHPSWSRAVGTGRAPDGRRLSSAAEFWTALGV